MSFFAKFFNSNEKELALLRQLVANINGFEVEVQKIKEADFTTKTKTWQEELKNLSYEEKQDYLNKILPEAFALVREASKRAVKMRHYDVQLMAGIALHQGKVAEQKTGEGKTLTATAPLYLNALTGDGTHLVTQNDYLASHHAAWMGPVYAYLGLTVGFITEDQGYIFDSAFDNPEFVDPIAKRLKPVTKSQAYSCHITYGTNHNFGFDYLRDNMVRFSEGVSQTNPNKNLGKHYFAIVDEADSLLIDVARTPLIISEPAEQSTQKYYEIAKLVKALEKGTDYDVDEKRNSATLTDLGIKKLERMLNVDNLYEKDFETVHHVEQALRAKALFAKDKDYILKDGKIVIVDKFTGRLLPSNRYGEGLHQAIEAKEGVEIQRESRTLAEISYQNYFRLYNKLAGMTGTAETEAEELNKIYKLEVIVIPTHMPMIRKDHSDVVYKTERGKFQAAAEEIEAKHKTGQPILVGTTSVEKSELLHEFLKRKGVPHEILNAKNHEREALIIENAGKRDAVTVSTNMAGRGVDILLGGANATQTEQEDVRKLGGLHVIGTERHESRRIDNQLRGRAGRQGDAGSSRFFVSLQDDLMRVFGGEMVERLMDKFGLDESVPLESRLVSTAIENAQKRVEGHNFDIRKRVVEFDDVMNQQRNVIYKLRRKILGLEDGGFNKEWFVGKITAFTEEDLNVLWDKWEKAFGLVEWHRAVSFYSLEVIDALWIEYLDEMDDVMEGIHLRGYAQKDPLVEYRKEGHDRFAHLAERIYANIAERFVNLAKSLEDDAVEKIEEAVKPVKLEAQSAKRLQYKYGEVETGVSAEEEEHKRFKVEPVKSGITKVGRNDPCPCGATKPDGTSVKYKNCHGKG
ncbi:MAG: preprotein translocase subunit SecA [Patescibacteria group bacterium]